MTSIIKFEVVLFEDGLPLLDVVREVQLVLDIFLKRFISFKTSLMCKNLLNILNFVWKLSIVYNPPQPVVLMTHIHMKMISL